MTDDKRSTTDQILDLLLDALIERQEKRQHETNIDAPQLLKLNAPEMANERDQIVAVASELSQIQPETIDHHIDEERIELSNTASITDFEKANTDLFQDAAIDEIDETIKPNLPLEPLPTIHLERTLSRWSIILAVLIIIVNIPFNRFGTSLARAMPDEQALIVRDGLVIKGTGDEVYVLEDNQKRWITTLDAFEWYGYNWDQVHIVEDEFLDEFSDGRPIYLLLKCGASPHVYALENGTKRWIKDIPTFVSQGFVWEDIKFVSCGFLRDLPQGTPIPADAGTPPQP